MTKNDNAARISEWSEALGGDGSLALYYSPAGNAGRHWQATTTTDAPRRRGRYLSVWGSSPDDALMRLLRTMPAVPSRRRVIE